MSTEIARLRVVGEAPGLLAVEKPPGLPTTSPDGRRCLVERVQTIARGAEVVHPSSRLDRDVTGVVVFATTSRAVKALLEARSRGRYRRLYVALLTPPLASSDPLVWSWPIAVDPRRKTFRVALEPGARGERAQDAETHTTIVASTPSLSLVHLFPQTGRTHQLRVHASRAGSPIFGDVDYGAPGRIVLPDGVVVSARRPLLHCARVEVVDERGRPQRFESPLPADQRSAWLGTHGDEAALALPTPPPLEPTPA